MTSEAAAIRDASLAELIDLSGHVALVTGAGQGLGFACARRLAEAGAGVMLVGQSSARVAAAARRIESGGGQAISASGDVRNPDDARRFVDSTVKEFGRLDILVNNAGVFSNHPLQSLELDEFRRIFSVNVDGTFLCTRAGVVQMLEQGSGGSIINMASINAVHPVSEGLSHYTTSKHAVWGFTKSLALELGPTGIRVNSIAPGIVATEGALAYLEAGASGETDLDEHWERAAKRLPLRRWPDPDEIGRIAVFLASDLASYVTGSQIVVDGGYLVG